MTCSTLDLHSRPIRYTYYSCLDSALALLCSVYSQLSALVLYDVSGSISVLPPVLRTPTHTVGIGCSVFNHGMSTHLIHSSSVPAVAPLSCRTGYSDRPSQHTSTSNPMLSSSVINSHLLRGVTLYYLLTNL